MGQLHGLKIAPYSPTMMTSGDCPEHTLRMAFPQSRRVLATLALVNHAQLVGMQVLDRIFYANNMNAPCPVDVVDHHGQGGGFAAAAGPVISTSPCGARGEIPEDVRQTNRAAGGRLNGTAARWHGKGACWRMKS